MATPHPASALRSARTARGWSQTEAAGELAELGQARGAPVASAASLKTLLSRWENGHSVPEPQYRTLLAELYGRTPVELGLEPGKPAPAHEELRARLAAAAAVDEGALGLWGEQLDLLHQLDAELGTAGAGGVLRALVEQLEHTLLHSVPASRRRAVAAVLADAATLAGTQALDAPDHPAAWQAYRTAHSAAVEAALPAARAVATAGLAAVLVDVGERATAETLLDEEQPSRPGPAWARWSAAKGLVAAAAGDRQEADRSFTAARRAVDPAARHTRIDLVRSRLSVELADVDRWWGHALATLGEPAAVEPLHRALAVGPTTARDRAALHADLAVALAVERPESAADHARTARELAARIGAQRITAQLSRVGAPP